MRLRAADEQQGAGLPQCIERVEIIEPCGMLVDEMFNPELLRVRNDARSGTRRLIAGSEEVEAKPIGKQWIAFNQRARGGKDRAQRRHAEWQQCAAVADVDAAVVRYQPRALLPPCDRVQVGWIPANRDLRRN